MTSTPMDNLIAYWILGTVLIFLGIMFILASHTIVSLSRKPAKRKKLRSQCKKEHGRKYSYVERIRSLALMGRSDPDAQ